MVHFVLIHGAGGGAWHWFKIVDRLIRSGHQVKAIDLAASGIDRRTHADICSFEEYNQPLIDYLTALRHDEKVVLVSHSHGGVCGAYATELFPEKIALGIYVASYLSSQSHASSKYVSNTSSRNIRGIKYLYGHGENNPPTARVRTGFGSSQLPCHQLCSSEDYTLTMILDRPAPTAADKADFTNTEEKYGRVPVVYVKTLQDMGIPVERQDEWIRNHPFGNLKEVMEIDTDHCPALSAPSELHELIIRAVESHM